MPLDSSSGLSLILPDWQGPANVKAMVTTRRGGASLPPWDTFNLGLHTGDEQNHVQSNRRTLERALALPEPPRWMSQVHGNRVVQASELARGPLEADAVVTGEGNRVCTVMTADCLPVFFAAIDGSEVALAHAGWRGLCNGVLEQTVSTMQTACADIVVWLGPAIGPQRFEVGEEVRQQFIHENQQAESSFKPFRKKQGKSYWLADIYQLARLRLEAIGLSNISGGEYCTFTQSDLFYSYRRDGDTGRMASLIWISD